MPKVCNSLGLLSFAGTTYYCGVYHISAFSLFLLAAVFGQPLVDTMLYESMQCNKKIPTVVELCVNYLMDVGLQHEGIFRLVGIILYLYLLYSTANLYFLTMYGNSSNVLPRHDEEGCNNQMQAFGKNVQ